MLYDRVSMASVCLAGREEKEGSHFSSVSASRASAKSANGEVEVASADDLIDLEGARSGDSKWVCERMMSALVRYDIMSVSIVESVGMDDGRGIDTRCRRDVLDVVEVLPVRVQSRGCI